MKREIKFRAWIPNVGWLADGFSISMDGKEWYDDNGHSFPLSDIELVQFTGLKDKNGKEICEGDIFDTGHEIRFVSGAFFAYKKGQATLPYTPENHYPLYRWDTGHIVGGVEVIGNIYENPELIKQ